MLKGLVDRDRDDVVEELPDVASQCFVKARRAVLRCSKALLPPNFIGSEFRLEPLTSPVFDKKFPRMLELLWILVLLGVGPVGFDGVCLVKVPKVPRGQLKSQLLQGLFVCIENRDGTPPRAVAPGSFAARSSSPLVRST